MGLLALLIETQPAVSSIDDDVIIKVYESHRVASGFGG